MKETSSILDYQEIQIGQVYQFERNFSIADVEAFANLSGDRNPLHIDKDYGDKSQFGQNIVHGMLVASLFSTLVGMHCPGQKSLYLSQSIEFRKPLFPLELVKARGTILEKTDSVRIIKMKTEILRDQETLVSGEARIKFEEF